MTDEEFDTLAQFISDHELPWPDEEDSRRFVAEARRARAEAAALGRLSNEWAFGSGEQAAYEAARAALAMNATGGTVKLKADCAGRLTHDEFTFCPVHDTKGGDR